MASGYTPGLKVSKYTHVRKLRRLPLSGEVIVSNGQQVKPDDVLARAELPGIMRTVRAAELLGVDPKDIHQALLIVEGDLVNKGDIIARTTSFFGMFKSECKAPTSGIVELINPISGNVGIREAPIPVEIKAYVDGKVVEVIPGEGAVVETFGALVQGIFGIGGERTGTIKVIAADPAEVTGPESVPDDSSGLVLIAGARAGLDTLRKATEAGAVGFIVAGVVDSDLVKYLGHDIGVAITGQEPISMTVILTEGFGELPMATRTWELLNSLDGQQASINGATQIRAGVIRPELIVTQPYSVASASDAEEGALEIGSPIRLIRDPYFGALGRVAELPAELQHVPSGAMVRVLVAELADGQRVTTPRANVELIER